MQRYVASHLKDMNRMTVYKLFTQNEEIFRGEISKLTGISAPTVLKIVSFMLENRLVLELGEREGAVGRKPQMLTLNPDALYTIGIVFEGAFVRAGIMNFKGELLHLLAVSATSDFHKDARNLIPGIISDLLNVIRIDKEKLKGICIGVPGSYDSKNNSVICAPLVGIYETEKMDWLTTWLAKEYDVLVTIENDVNLCVIGEYKARKLDEDDLIYINIGTGLGAGMILDGKLRTGENYQCGEIGYMNFADDGEYVAQRERPGWLEEKINIQALNRTWEHEKTSPEKIEYVSKYLSLCINNVATMVDCKNIVVGGVVLETAGVEIITEINKKLKRISLSEITVAPAKHIGVGVLGACCEVMDHVIMDVLVQ